MILLHNRLGRQQVSSRIQELAARNPSSSPVLGRQQSHLPPTRMAVRRRLPLRIPYADLPVVTASRFDGKAAVENIYGLIGVDSSAVPDVVILSQRFGRTGYANFIARLP